MVKFDSVPLRRRKETTPSFSDMVGSDDCVRGIRVEGGEQSAREECGGGEAETARVGSEGRHERRGGCLP